MVRYFFIKGQFINTSPIFIYIWLKINKNEINSTSELQEIISQFNPGENINCTIQREGENKEFVLSLQS